MSIFEKYLMKQLLFFNLDIDAIKQRIYLSTKGDFFFNDIFQICPFYAVNIFLF